MESVMSPPDAPEGNAQLAVSLLIGAAIVYLYYRWLEWSKAETTAFHDAMLADYRSKVEEVAENN
jgi:hypothetical protein